MAAERSGQRMGEQIPHSAGSAPVPADSAL